MVLSGIMEVYLECMDCACPRFLLFISPGLGVFFRELLNSNDQLNIRVMKESV